MPKSTQTQKSDKDGRPVVKVKPASYKPTKAELEEDMSVDATPEEVAEALTRAITVKVLPKN